MRDIMMVTIGKDKKMKNENNNKTTESKTAVFTMGLPGSGKSTMVRKSGLADGATIIDPDAVKKSHPNYDPKNCAPLHAWSKTVADAQLAAALADGTTRLVVDGTGVNAEVMMAKIRQVQAAGFKAVLLYV